MSESLPWGPASSPVSYSPDPNGPSTEQRAAIAAAKKRKKSLFGLAAVLALLAAGSLVFLGTSSKDEAFVLTANEQISPLSNLAADKFTVSGVALEDVVFSGTLPSDLPSSAQEVEDLFTEIGVLIADNEGALTSWRDTALSNFTAQFIIEKNQQLTESLVSNSNSGSAGGLLPNERLVSVQADLSAAVSGTLRPGDRVSVWAVYRASTGDSTSLVAGMVLEDAVIVSVQLPEDILRSIQQQQASNSNAAPSANASLLPGMYTLKIRAEDQARMAVVAGGEGVNIVLVYKPAGAESATPSPSSIIDAICAYNTASTVC